MTDIASIASSLSEAQRRGIKAARPFEFGAWLLPLGAARGLTALGCAARTIDGMCLTPLGLALRQHLINGDA